VANYESNNISILLGSGDGTFTPAINYSAGRGPESITSGDFDYDGDIDLAVANWVSGNVSVLFNLCEKVTTLLIASKCSVNGDEIEVSWTLERFFNTNEFVIYRKSKDISDFTLVETEVIYCGESSYKIVDKDCREGLLYQYRVYLAHEEGLRTLFTTKEIMVEALRLDLGQNYPNPFNPSTTIYFSISEKSHVTLDIFDVSGRKITRLVDSCPEPGLYKRKWTGCNDKGYMVTSGIYFYKLRSGKKSIIKKMILLR